MFHPNSKSLVPLFNTCCIGNGYLLFFSLSPVPFGKYWCIIPKLIYIAEEAYQMITGKKIGWEVPAIAI
jgi:hypothetical protein